VKADSPAAQMSSIPLSQRCSSAATMMGEVKDVPIAAGGSISKYFDYITPTTKSFDFASEHTRRHPIIHINIFFNSAQF